jgi:penicillin-binding protein 1A
VGYDSNQELGRGETGGGTALPIWTNFMQRVHRTLPVEQFPSPPEGIQQAEIDEETGLLAGPDMNGRTEYFLDGTVPTEVASPKSERSVEETILTGGGSSDPNGSNTTEESDESGQEGTIQDGF